jgi:hypothetical protein
LDDDQSSLYPFYHPDLQETNRDKAKQRADDLHRLKAATCVGHLLYLPLAETGPLEQTTFQFALPTVLTLKDLGLMVEKGKSVLLTIGVQHRTWKPKAILKTILSQQTPLITDLVCDSRSAESVLQSR